MTSEKVVNAIILDADLDIERVLTYWITLDYGGITQGFGGYALGGSSRFTELAITRLMEVVGVTRWSDLNESPVRAAIIDGKVRRIGHYLKDNWLDLEEVARECGLREPDALNGSARVTPPRCPECHHGGEKSYDGFCTRINCLCYCRKWIRERVAR